MTDVYDAPTGDDGRPRWVVNLIAALGRARYSDGRLVTDVGMGLQDELSNAGEGALFGAAENAARLAGYVATRLEIPDVLTADGATRAVQALDGALAIASRVADVEERLSRVDDTLAAREQQQGAAIVQSVDPAARTALALELLDRLLPVEPRTIDALRHDARVEMARDIVSWARTGGNGS